MRTLPHEQVDQTGFLTTRHYAHRITVRIDPLGQKNKAMCTTTNLSESSPISFKSGSAIPDMRYVPVR